MTLSVTLDHRFGDFALDLAFAAPAGLTALFGRSGAGKTSVVNAVAGLLRPAAGRVAVGARVLTDTEHRIFVAPHRRRIGMIFQDGRLFPHLTVRGNLRYGARFAPRGARPPAFDDVVDMLGIAALLDRRPGALSGGEKQRVAIGRALLAAPDLILADEPLAALDAARKAEILPWFERLRDAAGVPILYVSHDAAEVARLATTVVVLEAGRVTRQGPATEVLADPAVTPAGPREAGAVIAARVACHHADGLTELDAGGTALFVPRIAAAPGRVLRLRVPAGEVILARASAAPIAEQIWDMKYRLKEARWHAARRTVEDTWRRIARALARSRPTRPPGKERFYAALEDFRFLPAGRITGGAGTGAT
jgi:molybdate transport system ATP-binding protein